MVHTIGCNFPYHDRQEASRLIDIACQLSSNAAFIVAYELARPPRGELDKSHEMTRLAILDELEGKFDHPIQPMIFTICRKMIRGQPVTRDEALAALNCLKDYPGQYSAAAIAYFSCDEEAYLKQIDQQYQALIQSWENSHV